MGNTEKKERSPEEVAQDLSEHMGNKIEVIKEEDTFDFKCQRCGQCCIGRNDIVLSPYDIYKAAKYLGITTAEFVKEYANLHLGHTSKCPVFTLAIDNRGWCPFLKFDVKNGGLFGCTINDAKPDACRNHPIGIASSFKMEEDSNDINTAEFNEFYIKVEQCGNSKGHNNPVKVADWIAKSKATVDERKWSHKLQTIPHMTFDIRKFYTLMGIQSMGPENTENWSKEDKEKIEQVIDYTKELIKNFFDLTVELTYVNFDTNRPFCEQAEENAVKLQELCDKTKEMYDISYDAFIKSGANPAILEENW